MNIEPWEYINFISSAANAKKTTKQIVKDDDIEKSASKCTYHKEDNWFSYTYGDDLLSKENSVHNTSVEVPSTLDSFNELMKKTEAEFMEFRPSVWLIVEWRESFPHRVGLYCPSWEELQQWIDWEKQRFCTLEKIIITSF